MNEVSNRLRSTWEGWDKASPDDEPPTSDEQEPQGAGYVQHRTQEIAETTCGARSERILATCMLGIGHVHTMDDWHEATAQTTEHVETSIFESHIVRQETLRWAPSEFELRDRAAQRKINSRHNLDDDEDE
jgi:hypothetical protein